MKYNQIEYILSKYYDKGLIIFNNYDKYIGRIDEFTMDIRCEEGMLMYSVCDKNYKELYMVAINIDTIGMIEIIDIKEGDD